MTPYFIDHLMKSEKIDKSYDFSVIIRSSHHLNILQQNLGGNELLCIDREFEMQRDKGHSLDELTNFCGNIYSAIESQKVNMKHRKSEYQTEKAILTYRIVKKFIVDSEPEIILFIQPPEDMESCIIAGIARELEIPIAVPHHTRHLGLSFFTNNELEVLPEGSSNSSVSNSDLARNFLCNFREGLTSPSSIAWDHAVGLNYLDYRNSPRLRRLVQGIERFCHERGSVEWNTILIGLRNNWMPWYRDIVRSIRISRNKQIYNCKTVEDLPDKFIFYPIQYTPESSINIPSPYFIDQLRVIDAIRMVMPSDFHLVVKEHPVCISVRHGSFMKSLLHKAGVVVANIDLSTNYLIEHSELVISVTGTAAFEAFLNRKPSIVMGQTFFADAIGGVCDLGELEARIKSCIGSEINDEDIINFLSRLFSISEPFLGRTPGERSDFMMTEENLLAFWNAFIKFKKSIND